VPIREQDGETDSRVNLPICERFKKRSDHHGSCSSSLTAWAGGRESEIKHCHAYLNAVVIPIGLADASGAALYASGFLNADRDLEQVAAIPPDYGYTGDGIEIWSKDFDDTGALQTTVPSGVLSETSTYVFLLFFAKANGTGGMKATLTGTYVRTMNLAADIDGDGRLDLADLICVLQVLTRSPSAANHQGKDINGDGATGLAEAIYLLHEIGQ